MLAEILKSDSSLQSELNPFVKRVPTFFLSWDSSALSVDAFARVSKESASTVAKSLKVSFSGAQGISLESVTSCERQMEVISQKYIQPSVAADKRNILQGAVSFEEWTKWVICKTQLPNAEDCQRQWSLRDSSSKLKTLYVRKSQKEKKKMSYI